MNSRSLLTQVLVVNVLLVAATALVATLFVDAHIGGIPRSREVVVWSLALVATLLANWLLLRRRFHPLDAVISAMEETDLAAPRQSARLARSHESAEVRRLDAAFRRMIARLEAERRQAGRAAIRAQERERQRIAQDLHDEVNQALTAVSLRLQASIAQAPPDLEAELLETKRLSGQAMEELLTIARQLRPPLLDDHGLVPALASQVRRFREATGMDCNFIVTGEPYELTPEQQLVVYRVTQEGLSNVVQHAGAGHVEVELIFGEAASLRLRDDGRGFSEPREGGLGLSGMRERALLIGADLSIESEPGQGTRIELRLS